MNISLVMFLVFIAITLGITYWASKRSAGASAYFAAMPFCQPLICRTASPWRAIT